MATQTNEHRDMLQMRVLLIVVGGVRARGASSNVVFNPRLPIFTNIAIHTTETPMKRRNSLKNEKRFRPLVLYPPNTCLVGAHIDV